MNMMRKDREVTNLDEIMEIIAKCDVCRLAINGDDGYPYIVPLNFGYKLEGTRLTLYFHSALQGKKHELMRADPRASFEMDCGHTLISIPERGYCTMAYESVIGHGTLEYIEDDAAKMEALTLITDRYHPRHFAFNPAALPRTSVYRLSPTSLTAKRKPAPQK